jgi:molybdate transport system ATP-binding protein
MAFDIDISRQIGDRVIALRVAASPGVTVLTGPSGAGKTSILHMVAGLLRPDRGHIHIFSETMFDSTTGIDVPSARRRAGYVFQDRRIFPHMRVRANLVYGHRPDADAKMTLDDVVRFLGIGALLDRWPSTLSGGEAQRVAIGRALLSNPRFLLMDEPLSSLDRARRAEIMTVIERIRDELALPMLYVSHDGAEIDRLSDRVIVMETG